MSRRISRCNILNRLRGAWRRPDERFNRGGARLKLQIVEGQMISQQVNNSVNVQSVRSAQVSGGASVSATKALSGVTNGLVGSVSATSSSGSSAGVEATGSVSNLLGSSSTSQSESAFFTTAQMQQQLQERSDAAFNLKDPQGAANYPIELKGDNYDSISDYASAWTKKAANAALAGTSATANGQDPTAVRSLADCVMTPEAATQYYRDVIGIKTYGSMPSQNVQSCAPSCLQDGSLLASMDKWNAQVRNNLASKNTLPSSLTGSKSSTSGLTSYFQNTTPSVSDKKNALDDSHSSTLSSLGFKDTLYVFNDNSIAYEGLTSLYQNGTIAEGTKLSDNSALVPEFDYSEYMQQVQDMYGQGYDSMISDYVSACGLNDAPSISPDIVAVQNLQSTAMSTNELTVKYNSEMTDGILSLSELKAMYEKAFSAKGAFLA